MRLRYGWIVAIVAALTTLSVPAFADEPAASSPAASWFDEAIDQIEAEAVADAAAAPAIPDALDREWRTFDRQGSSLGVLADLGWIAIAALIALLAQRGIARLLSRRLRRRLRAEGPSLFGLLALLVCDLVGLAVFLAVFTAEQRHWLTRTGATIGLGLLALNVLVRWRLASLVIGAILRPDEPVARLIDMPDAEAHRLDRFLSIAILVIISLVGFGRYGLMDEDSGAAHVIGVLNAVIVCGHYVLIVFRARAAAGALIRGRRTTGVIAALRAGLARAWVAIALTLVTGLLVIFVAGLSLGLLSYYYAVTSTLGIQFVLLVLDRLTERVWHDSGPAPISLRSRDSMLQARTVHHILRALGLAVAVMALAWIWIDTIESEPAVSQTMRSTAAAVGTLFIAFVVWALIRLAIDRHLHETSGGPTLPGEEDDAGAPASRLQTILPLVRAAFGVVIGVLAALIVLSRLGVDTAPLIAGAGVFGLAVSFGSQSLVRDIISGLFYMWDDAFRVGEYIDTGRLKGTVETLGIRSVKLRHQNGPLNTIPYGQLGAVSNLSRDFATIKFNLRFEPGTDVELVRKSAKQIGLAMQDNPEIAAEIILPLKLQGVAEIVDNAVVLRFKFTARPVKPNWVQREYLKRMVQVFAEKDIRFATGATMVLQGVSSPVETLPPGAAARSTETAAAAASVAEASAIATIAPVAGPEPTPA